MITYCAQGKERAFKNKHHPLATLRGGPLAEIFKSLGVFLSTSREYYRMLSCPDALSLALRTTLMILVTLSKPSKVVPLALPWGLGPINSVKSEFGYWENA